MERQYSKFRVKLQLRRWLRQLLRGFSTTADFSGKYVFRRTEHLKQVQRFVLVWLAVVVIAGWGLWTQTAKLKLFYQIAGQRSGGTISEGVIGNIAIINPLYPENNATATANKLIFNGLVRYNGDGKIEGDLAEFWQVDDSGKIYTFQLRKGVQWHDGKPLMAKDVVFTFTTVQNSDVNSPLTASWKGISITAPDEQTVVFTLPVPYSPFLDTVSTGILPAHLLGTAEPAQLRKVEFNQRPIGTGPFRFKDFSLNRDELRLEANPDYFREQPQLDGFVLKLYSDQSALAGAYSAGQVTQVGGLRSLEIEGLYNLPNSKVLELPIANQSLVFLNTERPILQNKTLRQGLALATDVPAIVAQLGSGFQPAFGPLLRGQLGYNPNLQQLMYNQAQAAAYLDAAGWKVGEGDKRAQNGQPLSLELVTQNNDVYPTVAAVLQEQWAKAGVQLMVKLVSAEELQQNYLKPRSYDLALFGIAQGADPDVYPYWHSSQAKDPGFNLAQYRSSQADQALEGGRTRHIDQLRSAKYEAFEAAWRDDVPAIAVFRPVYFYATNQSVLGINARFLSGPTERFYNVEQWTIKTRPTLKRTPDR